MARVYSISSPRFPRGLPVSEEDQPKMQQLSSLSDVEDSASGSSSENEEQVNPMARGRKIALTFGVLTIGAVFIIAAVGVYPSVSKGVTDSDSPTGTSRSAGTQQELRSHFEHKVRSSEEPPMTIAKFVTTRQLAAVAAPAFDTKCPLFHPKCDLADHFNDLVQKEMNFLTEHDTDIAMHLFNTTLTANEQRIIMEILPIAHNKSVIDLGHRIAMTVKRWASKGEEVVHEKVRETLAQYSKEKGINWNPPSNTSKPGTWKALMHPKVLSLIGDGNDNDSGTMASRRLFFDPLVVAQSIIGSGLLLRLILLIFQILNKTKVLKFPLWLKATIMWGNLIGGGITCIATILVWCPILFLQYWFNAWLLFSNEPRQMDDWRVMPFGKWMREHLPGFGQTRLLRAMDPRIAA